MSKSKQVLVSVSLLAMLHAGASFGAEWPSWRGPSQMGVSTETGLISDWSPDGENLIWRQDFVGRSTPVVMNGRVFVNGRTGTGIDSQAVIAAYDAQAGAPVWEHRYTLYLTTVPYNRVGWASLTGDPETGNIYAQLVNGTFLCLNGDGETVWSRSLKEEFGRFEGYGGRTASAVIDEERVIVNMINGSWGPQGPPRHRYFAFDKRSGDVVWMSTPGGNVYDRNTQSVPVVSVVDGQRLLIGGSADGHVYALQARTGKKVWEFELSKRGINVSPVVADGRVFISHSEENVDEGALGRVVAIDATGSGDVTSTHELWRWNRQQAGFPSPAIHDGRVYVIDNSANLSSLDAETGEIHWEISIGTVGKASPVWADGKIYATETNGHLAIVQPGQSEASILSRHQLEVPEGRYAELYGSAAIAYGRIYFTTEEGVYCLGDPSADFAATRSPEPSRGDEGAAEGDPAMLIVVPAEVTIAPGGRFDFEVLAFDAKGRPLGQVDAEVELKGLAGDLSSKRFAVGADSGFQAGTVIAKAAGLEAFARVRVFPPLPWSDDFSDGRKGWWIGAGRYEVRDDGTLVKPVAARGLLRSPLLLGPPSLEDYTIQVDMKPAQKGRRRTDGGVINSGYILDLLGIHQRLQIRSWTAVPRIDVTADYTVEMDRWYTLKLKVTQDGATALVQGKVWLRGEAEPSEWTVTSTDPHPVLRGSPGILGYSPAEVAYDNVQITGN